jgi:hypothetical protein
MFRARSGRLPTNALNRTGRGNDGRGFFDSHLIIKGVLHDTSRLAMPVNSSRCTSLLPSVRASRRWSTASSPAAPLVLPPTEMATTSGRTSDTDKLLKRLRTPSIPPRAFHPFSDQFRPLDIRRNCLLPAFRTPLDSLSPSTSSRS